MYIYKLPTPLLMTKEHGYKNTIRNETVTGQPSSLCSESHPAAFLLGYVRQASWSLSSSVSSAMISVPSAHNICRSLVPLSQKEGMGESL